jgi:hypothetical protein
MAARESPRLCSAWIRPTVSVFISLGLPSVTPCDAFLGECVAGALSDQPPFANCANVASTFAIISPAGRQRRRTRRATRRNHRLRELFDGSWTRHVGTDRGRTLHWGRASGDPGVTLALLGFAKPETKNCA